MLIRILTVALFLAIMGLLIAQRFYSIPPQLPVTVVDIQDENAYTIGDELKRGQIIETANGYMKLSIDNRVSVWLAPNTRIELDRLFEDELTIGFTKGRILVDAHADIPFTIKTNFTRQVLFDDVATFVNYDFLETVQVIPLSGSVQVDLESVGEQLLTPVPLSIHETSPVTYEKLEVNLAAADAANFYRWTGLLIQN